MSRLLLSVSLRYEHDVVLARQRAREIAALLGFDSGDQVRIATAVSEIARNAFQYAVRGKVEFLVTEAVPQLFGIRVVDAGPGIAHLNDVLDGHYVSSTGMGLGLVGARRLMDEFHVESVPGRGTIVSMGKQLPRKSGRFTGATAGRLVEQLTLQPLQNPLEEIQRQNQELLGTLAELQRRQAELAQLNKELEDTNRGVVALYAELDEKADYLRRASELKTQFLSNMTHEFRTPLNSILSLSRLLLERLDGDLTRDQERQVRFIQKAANDLSDIVNDLLDLAKVEAGKVVVRPAEFHVADLMGALRGMLRPLLAHNNSVALVFDDPTGVPVLHTDESKVSQVLRNLISNALKYTEKGEVRVTFGVEPGGQVVFTVADTGIGIAPADQERIFEEFTQVEGPHQAGKRGTGLGLPLSRKLAGLLGGTLKVESELGKGSRFTLRIPAVFRGATEISFVPELPAEVDPVRCPVLVVEDNRETLFVYEKYLRGTGFQPIPARTLKQARDALKRFRPVAVILDILLSQENTWAFLADLKADEATREIPVFVVTVVENHHKALALGADDFHAKPVDRHWLVRKLGALAGGRRNEVLVVDDDEVSRYLLKSAFAHTRFQVVEAGSALEGLRLAAERRPAAVFLDLIMPDLSGFDVIQRMKSCEATREIPIIVHSAKMLTMRERGLLEQIGVPIVDKNTDHEQMRRSIRDALLKVQPAMDANGAWNGERTQRGEGASQRD